MTMIDALQIDCVELTGPTSGQGVMHLTSYHAQPQGYLNGGATLAFGEILSGMISNQLIRDDQFAVYDESHSLISQVTVTCAIVPKNR